MDYGNEAPDPAGRTRAQEQEQRANTDRLGKFLIATGATLRVAFGGKTGGFLAGAEWGQEAEDSPMAGAAAYGVGDTPGQAITALLDDAGQ